MREYAGGYDEWLARKVSPERVSRNPQPVKEKKILPRVKTKLTMREQKELQEIPAIIEEKEKRKKEIYAILSDPAFYRESGSETTSLKAEIESIDRDLEKIFKRWEELEAYTGGTSG